MPIVSEFSPGIGLMCLSSEMSVKLLPTPKATNNENRQSLDRYGLNLGMALDDLRLLPTPTAPDFKGGNTPQDQLQDVVDRMNQASILSSADSPVSPLATPVSVKLNLMIGGCGLKWQESFAHFDPDLSLWRTSQGSLLPDSEMCSVTWPQRGMTVSGSAYELPMSALLTEESDCSSSPLLPTPQAFDATGGNRSEEARARALTKGGFSNLREIVQLLPTQTTDDAHNTTRASGEFLSLARTAHNLSLGEPTSQPSEGGKP